MPEAKRALTGDEREGGAHELAPRQQLERGIHLGTAGPRDQRLQAAHVEGLAFDRARFDDPALGHAERVEAGGQERVQRRRERAGLAALAHVGCELLEEQRVATRALDHLRQRCIGHGARLEQAAAGVRVQRRPR